MLNSRWLCWWLFAMAWTVRQRWVIYLQWAILSQKRWQESLAIRNNGYWHVLIVGHIWRILPALQAISQVVNSGWLCQQLFMMVWTATRWWWVIYLQQTSQSQMRLQESLVMRDNVCWGVLKVGNLWKILHVSQALLVVALGSWHGSSLCYNDIIYGIMGIKDSFLGLTNQSSTSQQTEIDQIMKKRVNFGNYWQMIILLLNYYQLSISCNQALNIFHVKIRILSSILQKEETMHYRHKWFILINIKLYCMMQNRY